jgi:hypothetical protein
LFSYPNVLLIGANARNAGKTTLACSLIRKFSFDFPLIGLKVTRTCIREEQFHGTHGEPELEGWFLNEEINYSGTKDTHRMLEAGAQKVFYLRSNEDKIEEAFLSFMKEIGKNSLIVCESRSLRRFIKPAIFIMMMNEQPVSQSKEVQSYLRFADIVSNRGNDENSIMEIVSRVEIQDHLWFLR